MAKTLSHLADRPIQQLSQLSDLSILRSYNRAHRKSCCVCINILTLSEMLFFSSSPLSLALSLPLSLENFSVSQLRIFFHLLPLSLLLHSPHLPHFLWYADLLSLSLVNFVVVVVVAFGAPTKRFIMAVPSRNCPMESAMCGKELWILCKWTIESMSWAELIANCVRNCDREKLRIDYSAIFNCAFYLG